jgi:membrane fusion protein (multidrug efflux system)
LETAASANGDANETKNAGTRRPLHSGRKILWAVGFLALLGLGVLAYWFFVLRGIVYTDDARFDADVIDVAPQISGQIIEIRVAEGDTVTKGEILVVLDKRSLTAALAKSEAAVESARASVAAAQAEYDKAVNGPLPREIQIAEATERQLQAEAALATTEWESTEKLYNEGATTKSTYDEARAKWQSAVNAHTAAAQRLALLREGTRKEDLAAAKAKLELARTQMTKAEAEAEQARVDLDHASACSPCDGYVVRRWRDPGAVVEMGTPVLTVMDPSTLHVAANIKEKALDKIAIGDTAVVTIDAYPGVRLTGRVTSILRATNSQFSLIPAEGVSGTYIKVAQRVPLRIAVDVPPGLDIGPGLSVEVSIRIGSGSSRGGAAHGNE